MCSRINTKIFCGELILRLTKQKLSAIIIDIRYKTKYRRHAEFRVLLSKEKSMKDRPLSRKALRAKREIA